MDQANQSSTGNIFSAKPGLVIPSEEVQKDLEAQAQKFDAARKEALALAREKANQAAQKEGDKKDS
ncbi:hypothetical protein TWF718_011307 [Orbilia javanica]|uniref:Uncharacterized protein n=1 Tax=Orbilia javanica TaxID=47235 RepID=A0AAN8MH59_9PEZI